MRIVFQQNEATSHTSRATQSYLKDNTPSFIKKDEWSPQSRDCNPMDYCVWDSLSEKVYSGRTTVLKEEKPKNAIRQKWREILYLRMQFDRRFCLGKNRCEQFAMKAEATSINCSISLNMSMALQLFSSLHFLANNFKSNGVPLFFTYKAEIFSKSIDCLCHDVYQI